MDRCVAMTATCDDIGRMEEAPSQPTAADANRRRQKAPTRALFTADGGPPSSAPSRTLKMRKRLAVEPKTPAAIAVSFRPTLRWRLRKPIFTPSLPIRTTLSSSDAEPSTNPSSSTAHACPSRAPVSSTRTSARVEIEMFVQSSFNCRRARL